jgi:NAD(P)-dependent dehydrogenase (short-subunit alcohol dehydrogenase family)
MSEDRHAQQDPTLKHPQPEFPQQDQRDQHPGLEGRMEPRPDYGEETYRGCGKLEGKAAVITGGDSGIGRAVALAFAREGADVLISYLEVEESDAQETARVVEESGKRCVRVGGDISEEAQCNRVIERAVEEFGRVDVLVNNAAHQRTVSGVVDVSTELLDKTFKTNIYAMFWLVKAAIPHMPQGGAIINVGSAQAFKPSPTLLPYSATKGSIVTFTEGLAQDVVQYGLRANCVAPGPVWTPIIPASMEGETVSQFGAQSPMGRPGQPVELAPAFVFLASDDASYVNGSVIDVTGGQPVA